MPINNVSINPRYKPGFWHKITQDPSYQNRFLENWFGICGAIIFATLCGLAAYLSIGGLIDGLKLILN